MNYTSIELLDFCIKSVNINGTIVTIRCASRACIEPDSYLLTGSNIHTDFIGHIPTIFSGFASESQRTSNSGASIGIKNLESEFCFTNASINIRSICGTICSSPGYLESNLITLDGFCGARVSIGKGKRPHFIVTFVEIFDTSCKCSGCKSTSQQKDKRSYHTNDPKAKSFACSCHSSETSFSITSQLFY